MYLPFLSLLYHWPPSILFRLQAQEERRDMILLEVASRFVD